MLEVARKYAVDGLHFDYIRYPDREHCYCDGCRERFEAAERPARSPTGRRTATPARGARSTTTGGASRSPRWWRPCTARRKKLRPELKISAAVFGSLSRVAASRSPRTGRRGSRPATSISSARWTTRNSDTQFARWSQNQLKLVDGRIPHLSGHRRHGLAVRRCRPTAWSGRSTHARRSARPASRSSISTAAPPQSIVPGVGLGVGRQKAVPPHQ